MKRENRLLLGFIVSSALLIIIFYIANKPSLAIYTLIIIPLVFYLILVLPEFRKVNTPDKFFLIDRKMKAPQFRHTYVVTNIGLASSFLFSATIGYYFGLSALIWGPLTWALGIFLYYLLVPKIIPHLSSDHTLHEFLANRYSNNDDQNIRMRSLTSIVTSLIFWSLMSVEIYMATIILKPMLGNVPSFSIAIIIALVAFVYSYIAGYTGVVKTDKYQYYVMISACIIFIFIVGYTYTKQAEVSFPSELTNIFSMGWKMIIALFLVSLPYQLCMMDMWQRTFAMSKSYSTKSEFSKKLRKQLIFSIFIYTLIFWIFMIVGICVRLVVGAGIDSNLILNNFFELTQNIGQVGYLLYGILLMGIIAAIISTVDSYLNSLTQTFMYDIYSTRINKNLFKSYATFTDKENKRFVNVSRFFIPIFGLSGIILVFFAFGIFNFLMNIYTLAIILFPATLYAILKPKNKLYFNRAYYSIIIGFISVLLLTLVGTFILKNDDIPLFAPLIGILISFGIMSSKPKVKNVEQSKSNSL